MEDFIVQEMKGLNKNNLKFIKLITIGTKYIH